ncbi:MAG: DUF5990 family protein [Ardenticatenaceae bacterium]|nr:DUF5990 family protein [Ardenticatenaceae bacterium]
MDIMLPLKILLENPPPNFAFALQRGKGEKVDYILSDGSNISFTLQVRVKPKKDGEPNFLGPFTQGKPDQRFVYVCSGIGTTSENTEWIRRAKIHLSSIDWSLIEASQQMSDACLEARFAGTDPKGGPACATVPLLGGGWQLEK